MKYAIILLTTLSLAACNSTTTTGGEEKAQLEAAQHDSLPMDTMPPDNTQALDTAQRSGKAE